MVAKPTFKRKQKKVYQYVTFESDLFDGTFKLPKFEHMSVKVIAALNAGELDKLIEWLRGADVEELMIEAIESLDQTEIQEFITAWGKGQPVPLPKS